MTMTIDRVKTYNLPLLEEALSIEIGHYVASGATEADWRKICHRLTSMPASKSLPNAHAPNRLEQAVINLKAVELWPW